MVKQKIPLSELDKLLREVDDSQQFKRGVDQDRYLRNLKAPTDGGKK